MDLPRLLISEQRLRVFMEESAMRRLLLGTVLGLALTANVGCLLPIYSGDPAIRTRELIFTSENFRAILDEWERIWLLDMPDHMTPRRVHGGIM
jgi:hypothetical protein